MGASREGAVGWARPVGWWLQHAWDASVPNNLLSVSGSVARPPPPACASGTSQASRTGRRPVSAPRDAPGLCVLLLLGVLPLPRTAPAPSTTAVRVPRGRSTAGGDALA